MKICHIAPFAPFQCGLYEACYDMYQADNIYGHEVYFIDAGKTEKGKFIEGKPDQVDQRDNKKLITSKPEVIHDCDLIIMHTGYSDNIIVQNDKPLVWILHGRPEACFIPEVNGKGQSYTLTYNISRWQRTKKLIYFWDEFTIPWKSVLPSEKLKLIKNPVIDETRYTSIGKKYDFKIKGDFNILICDSEREDQSLHDIICDCIELCKIMPDLNIKVHFFGLDFPLNEPFNILLSHLNNIGGLGDRLGRFPDMPSVYRSVDCLLTPHKIVTRCIGESLSCNTPVISKGMNFNSTYFYNNINDLKLNITNIINNTGYQIKDKDRFNINNYNKAINEVYEEIIF